MNQTGDYPTVDLGERTRVGLPLVWLVPIITAIAGFGAGGWALRDQGQRLAAVELRAADHALRLERSDSDYRHIISTLERIERKLDRAERRGTAPGGGE